MQNYINEKMKDFAMNIDDFNIVQIVFDTDKKECVITDKTLNSIEVFIKKKSKEGVNSKQWFDMKSFNNRFKK